MTDAAHTETTAAPPAPLEPPADLAWGLGARIGDWLNPVLVKEVRQAQRGRVFTVALVVTVLITLLSCVIMALDLNHGMSQPGRDFFTAIYVFVCGALLLVVPFQAFSSMGSEWDEHTYEMLVLSNLKPRQIILGKLLSAVLQGSMLLAIFLPFIATAFLLRGVDMLVLAVVLGLTAYASVWLSVFAIMLSAITKHRLLRVLLMVMLGGGLVSVISAAVAISQEFINRPDQIASTEFFVGAAQVLVVASLAGWLAFIIACNLLAHEEENRSTNVRVFVTFALFLCLGLLALNVYLPPVRIPQEVVFGMSTLGMFLLAVAGIYLCSESEALGRRVAPTVPKSRGLALLTLPWFPGAGRGAVFLLLHMGLLTLGAFVVAVFADPSAYPLSGMAGVEHSLMREGGIALLLAALYSILYTLVPIGLVWVFVGNTAGRRKFVRTIAIFSPLLYIVIPAIFGLIVDNDTLRQMNHAGNPIPTIANSVQYGLWSGDAVFFILVPLALVGVALALPRVFRAVRETLATSEARVSASMTQGAAASELPSES